MSNASVGGGGASVAGGDDFGNVTIDEHGRPVQGGVGVGLVPGHLPQSKKAGGGGLGNQSVVSGSVRGGGNKNVSPAGRAG